MLSLKLKTCTKPRISKMLFSLGIFKNLNKKYRRTVYFGVHVLLAQPDFTEITTAKNNCVLGETCCSKFLEWSKVRICNKKQNRKVKSKLNKINICVAFLDFYYVRCHDRHRQSSPWNHPRPRKHSWTLRCAFFLSFAYDSSH